jgi:hypothetical protein
MTLKQILDKYCIARCQKDTKTQLEVADRIVDHEVPTLIERLGEMMMDRNRLVNEPRDERESNP